MISKQSAYGLIGHYWKECNYRIDKQRAEALDAISKGTGMVPVFSTDIFSIFPRYTSVVDDYTQDDQSYTCDDLDGGEDKLNRERYGMG